MCWLRFNSQTTGSLELVELRAFLQEIVLVVERTDEVFKVTHLDANILNEREMTRERKRNDQGAGGNMEQRRTRWSVNHLTFPISCICCTEKEERPLWSAILLNSRTNLLP